MTRRLRHDDDFAELVIALIIFVMVAAVIFR